MPEEDEKKETTEEKEEEKEEKKKLSVKTQVAELAPCRKKISIEVPVEEVQGRYDDSMKEFSAECIYPGFRKGRAPLVLVERKFGKDVTRELKGKLLAEAVTRAFEEASISPMSVPDIDAEKIELEKDKPLTFDFELDVKPDFEPPTYKGLKLERPPEKPAGDEVNDYIEGIRRRSADLEVVEDGAAEGDILTCDGRLTSGEEELWKEKESPIAIEKKKLLGVPVEASPDFMLGCKAGEARELKLKLGKDLGEEHEGKEAVLEIVLREVRRPRLPPLDDEFAKKFGAESVDALRNAVQTQISAEKERAAREELFTRAREKILEEAKFDLPERIVKEQAEALKQRVTYRFLKGGASEEKIEERAEEIKDASLRGAERMIRSYLVFEKIAEAEAIEVNEIEIARAIDRLARTHGLRPEYLRRIMEQEGTLSTLQSDILEQKVLQFIVDSADKPDGKDELGG